MKARARRHSKFLSHDDGDPLSVVVNLFDVAIVFAVALMVSMVLHLNMTELFTQEDFTIVKNPGQDNMQIIIKEAGRINKYAPADNPAQGATRGKRIGIAYELEDGQIIYVPETPTP